MQAFKSASAKSRWCWAALEASHVQSVPFSRISDLFECHRLGQLEHFVSLAEHVTTCLSMQMAAGSRQSIFVAFLSQFEGVEVHLAWPEARGS